MVMVAVLFTPLTWFLFMYTVGIIAVSIGVVRRFTRERENGDRTSHNRS